uniref:Expansin-like CBD domain-containing protein n=1 Tax=Picea sitchensis TaxID=3332 RepID=D5A806_PICSI|nr:unknown [Picea sitchensis]
MATHGKTPALLNSGELPVLYRRTFCKYPGKNISFHVTEGSTVYWFSILIEYEDGDGDVGAVHLKQVDSNAWMEMRHIWGVNWFLPGGAPLKAPFSVRVTTLTSKRTLSAMNVIPEHWYPNATYSARVKFD